MTTAQRLGWQSGCDPGPVAVVQNDRESAASYPGHLLGAILVLDWWDLQNEPLNGGRNLADRVRQAGSRFSSIARLGSERPTSDMRVRRLQLNLPILLVMWAVWAVCLWSSSRLLRSSVQFFSLFAYVLQITRNRISHLGLRLASRHCCARLRPCAPTCRRRGLSRISCLPPP